MGLYIHVPFCGSICSYCHFARTADHDRHAHERYVDGVLRELELRGGECAIVRDRTRPLATAYLGGGTPSQLEPDLMRRLLAGTVDAFPHTGDFELTAEANPESFTAELAEAWRAAGIGRVSLGVQSLREDVLELLGRACSPAAARRALALACRTFPRVSADWILGPRLKVEPLLRELDEALDAGVEHFSLYILEIHDGTALQRDVREGRVRLPADEQTERIYLAAGEHLEKRGIRQYEVANFARPGAESRHNRAYWERRPYLGLGPGAHGYWGRRRYANETDSARWFAALTAGRLPEAEIDELDGPSRRLESVILPLRTARGVPLSRLPSGALDLEAGGERGWWTVNDGRLVLTRRGFLRIDGIEEALAAGILP